MSTPKPLDLDKLAELANRWPEGCGDMAIDPGDLLSLIADAWIGRLARAHYEAAEANGLDKDDFMAGRVKAETFVVSGAREVLARRALLAALKAEKESTHGSA